MRKLMISLLFAGLSCPLIVEAMPTEADLQKVRPILKELTDNDFAALRAGKKTRAELADSLLGYVGEAESEAAKFSLIQSAFKNYMGDYDSEKAVMAFDMLAANVKDVPRGTFGNWCTQFLASFAKNGRADALAVLLNKSLDSGDSKSTLIIMDALRPYLRKLGAGSKAANTPFAVAADRASRHERRIRELSALKAAVRKNPGDTSAHEKLALVLAATDGWSSALKEFALAAGPVAEAAAWEMKWPDVGESSWTPAKAADLWWNCASAAKDEDVAAILRGRSSAWYNVAIDRGELSGLRKTIAEKRIREAEQSGVVANLGGSNLRSGNAMTFTLPGGTKMDFVPCPAGTFTMGFDGGAPMHSPHKVRISRQFWAGKFLVTRLQWNELMNPRQMNEKEVALGGLNGAVTDVSRVEVEDFCSNLTKRFAKQLPKGYVFRLPTLAEREYMFRANHKPGSSPFAKAQGLTRDELSAICVGDEGKRDILRRKNVDSVWRNPGDCPSVEVGLKKPNPWGLYDLIGNVDQWAMDVAPSSRTRFVTSAKDLAWADGADPLFWCDDGIDGAGIFNTTRQAKAWGELELLYAAPGRRWHSVGFRIVIAPDLIAERKLNLRKSAR